MGSLPGLIQNAHIELKFDMNDPKVNLNVFKYFRGHLRSLRGRAKHTKNILRSFKVMKGSYEVTSGLIQNAPIELKFDMNDPYVDLNILEISWGHSRSLRGSFWGHFRFDTKCSNWAEIWYEWSLGRSKHTKNILGSFKVIKGSLWGHFRFDTKCSYWAEIWYEWS